MKKLISLLLVVAVIFLHAQTSPHLVGMTSNGGTFNTGTIFGYTGGDTMVNVDVNFPTSPYGYNGQCMTLTLARDGKFYALDQTYTHGGALISYDYIAHSYQEMVSVSQYDIGDTLFAYESNWSLAAANNGRLYGALNCQGAGGLCFNVVGYAPNSSSFINYTGVFCADAPSIECPLMQASDGMLYGIAVLPSDSTPQFTIGMIFRFNPLTGVTTPLDTMPANSNPDCTMVERGSDTLYGTTYEDGIYNNGTIFRYVVASGSYTVLYNLPSSFEPGVSSLTLATDGRLYGATALGGSFNRGTLFCFDPDSGIYTVLHTFGDSTDDGWAPISDMLQASNGILYGWTSYGGKNNLGTIYQYNISTGAYTKNVDLDSTTGFYPGRGHLAEYFAVAVNRQPLNETICTGSPASFIATDTAAVYTVQWQVSTDSGATYTNIGGATDTTYSFVPPLTDSGYLYRAIFTHNLVNDTSDAAQLSFWPVDAADTTAIICAGQSFTVGTNSYSTSGSYTDTLIGASIHGCDSIITLNLTINPVYHDTITDSVCSGDTFYVGHFAHTAAGNYRDTLNTIYGCDSIVNLNLTIKPTPVVTLSWDSLIADSEIVGSASFGLWIPCFNLPSIITLTGGTPPGGNYSGEAVYNGVLYVDSIYYNYIPHSTPFDTITYTYLGTGNCSGTAQDIINVQPCEAINNISLNSQISLYPNPATDLIYIKTEGFQAQTTNIYDVNGQLVYTSRFTPQLDVSKLTPGAYLIEVAAPEGTARRMFVKM